MSARFSARAAVLPPAQLRLWPQLSKLTGLGMVLYGGTAVALRLGHRSSVDFDFFTERPLDREGLGRAFPALNRAKVLQEAKDTLTVLVVDSVVAQEHVKVSFFGGVTMGRVGEPARTDDEILEVASLEDLMATKLKVLLQRIEAKDYFDIAAMVEAGVSLSGGLSAARVLYGSSFQPSESLKALTYFEGGDLAALPGTIRKTLIQAASGVGDLPVVQRSNCRLSSGDSDV